MISNRMKWTTAILTSLVLAAGVSVALACDKGEPTAADGKTVAEKTPCGAHAAAAPAVAANGAVVPAAAVAVGPDKPVVATATADGKPCPMAAMAAKAGGAPCPHAAEMAAKNADGTAKPCAAHDGKPCPMKAAAEAVAKNEGTERPH